MKKNDEGRMSPSGRRGRSKTQGNLIDLQVGKRVMQRRNQLGISQQILADKLGITQQQLQKYERAVNRISASRLWDIAAALDVPVPYFFGEPEAPRLRKVIPPDLTAFPDAPVEEATSLIQGFEQLHPRVRNRLLKLAIDLCAMSEDAQTA